MINARNDISDLKLTAKTDGRTLKRTIFVTLPSILEKAKAPFKTDMYYRNSVSKKTDKYVGQNYLLSSDSF